jgi:hypothetical protein
MGQVAAHGESSFSGKFPTAGKPDTSYTGGVAPILTGIPFLLSRRRQCTANYRCCYLFCIRSRAKEPNVPCRALAPDPKAMICLISKRFPGHLPSPAPLHIPDWIPDWFRFAAAHCYPPGAGNASVRRRTGTSSECSLPTIASSSGHALPTGRGLHQPPPQVAQAVCDYAQPHS